jgi:hypothetical protein
MTRPVAAVVLPLPLPVNTGTKSLHIFCTLQFHLGSRQQIIPLDCAGFWLAYKAHPAAHIEIRVVGCNAVDEPKDKQDVELFVAGALISAGFQAGSELYNRRPRSPPARPPFDELLGHELSVRH